MPGEQTESQQYVLFTIFRSELMTNFLHSSLEAAFTEALSAFFPKIKPNTTMIEFFTTYLKEVEAFDRGFTKKHDKDLNTTLIFVSLPLRCASPSNT
jgi:hypothetical protein